MTESYITVQNGKCVGFSGPDSMAYVRAVMLASGLKLYVNTGGKIIPTRGMTITKMLILASQITDKTYKRKEAMQASVDVLKWAHEMKAAIPMVGE